MSIEEYYQKRKAVQEKEAMELVKEYRKVFDENPEEKHLSEFFWLFSNGGAIYQSVWRKCYF